MKLSLALSSNNTSLGFSKLYCEYNDFSEDANFNLRSFSHMQK